MSQHVKEKQGVRVVTTEGTSGDYRGGQRGSGGQVLESSVCFAWWEMEIHQKFWSTATMSSDLCFNNIPLATK